MSIAHLLADGLVIPKWRAHDVREWDRLYVQGELNRASATLINLTLVIGVSRITEDNAREVWLRLATLQAMTGALLLDGAGREVYFTLADVERHIGLETESADMSLSNFLESALRVKVRKPGDVCRSANGGKTALEVFGIAETR